MMLQRSLVFKILYWLMGALICFLLYWFYIKPWWPVLETATLEPSFWNLMKWGLWGFLKGGVFWLLAFFMFFLGTCFSEELLKLREYQQWKRLVFLAITTAGAMWLVTFLNKVVEDAAMTAVIGVMLPSVSISKCLAMESVAFVGGIAHKLGYGDNSS